MLRIALVTNLYPSDGEPKRGTFVYSLVQEFCRQGAAVSVIAPRSVYHGWRSFGPSSASYGLERATVVRPRYVSFSDRSIRHGFSTALLGNPAFAGSVLRSARRLPFVPQVVYGHFLFHAGAAAVRLAKRLQIPVVVAMGESRPARTERLFGLKRMREVAAQCDGMVVVSPQLHEYCTERLNVSPERILLLPNATDARRFYPRPREEMRRKLGLPENVPIVAFAGLFTERKGPLRLLASLERIPNVGAVFLGDGPQRPKGDKVLFAGKVPHDEVPEWLSAADLFVLPTLAEGSCNAIAEALACGLPVISSDIPAVRSQLGDGSALLTSPHDIPALEELIRALLDDPQRRSEMAASGVDRAQAFTLQDRARIILEWINRVLEARRSGTANSPPQLALPNLTRGTQRSQSRDRLSAENG